MEHANRLLADGKAFLCDNGAIALKLSDNLPVTWHDTVVGDVNINDKDKEVINGLILIKGDGFPTYHFATAVDDAQMKIDYIIRGVDHISNTAKHIAIWAALDKPIPKIAHVGLIHYKKKKLSKRDGAASMMHYMNAGYDPDAVLNCCLRLGWGPTVDDKSTKIINKERAIEMFLSLGKMRAPASNFDPALLDSFDRKYKARKIKK